MSRQRLGLLAYLGQLAAFCAQVARVLHRPLGHRRGLRQVLQAAHEVGVRSALLVAVVCGFAGAMLAVQGFATLRQLGAPELLGMFVGLGGFREVFPLVAAGTIGARAGCAIAAELATLRVGEQLDAMEVMGVDPLAHLVAPRLLGAIAVTPLLMVVGTISGLGVAYLTATIQLQVDPGGYLVRTFAPLTTNDLVAVLVKGAIFGTVIVLITAFEGIRATGGAAGVGVAANRAVVRAMIAGSLFNASLSQLFFGGVS